MRSLEQQKSHKVCSTRLKAGPCGEASLMVKHSLYLGKYLICEYPPEVSSKELKRIRTSQRARASSVILGRSFK